MMKNLFRKTTYVGSLTVLSSVIATGSASAQFADEARDGITDTGGVQGDGDIPTLLQTIVNTLLFLVGATSVIMLVIAGLRFVFSQGDQQQAASARNTILYSLIGLAVAVLAWAIVNYVLGILYDG